MTKQLCRYAFTLHGEDFDDAKIENVKSALEKKCSRWVFQLEKGEETEKEHIQGRCSFKIARRLGECQKVIPGAHFSPEHDTAGGDFYCTKEETRVKGPWSDQDVKHPLPWDLEKITEWKLWQTSVFASLNEKDDRTINVLVDKKGGIGKSKVFKFALWKKWAGLIPVVGDAKDIIQAVCSMGARKAYILDMPRSGESEQHQRSIWKAVEQIKNGVVMDFRYKYTELIMGSPVIWVFTNEDVERHHLSSDRWKFWRVDEESEMLVRSSRRCAVIV